MSLATTRLSVLATCTIVGVLLAACDGQESSLLRTSVCEVVGHPERYVGKSVVFSARYVAVGVEGSHFHDASCPGAAVEMRWTPNVEKQMALSEFHAVLKSLGPMGTYSKKISGDFAGTVEIVNVLGRDYPALVLENVGNLRVEPDLADVPLGDYKLWGHVTN